MAVTIRQVILPNGKKASEYETLHIGSSETTSTYEYKTVHAIGRFSWERQVAGRFARDCDGRIRGLTFL